MVYEMIVEYGLYLTLGIGVIVPLVSMIVGRTSRIVAYLAWLGVISFAASTVALAIATSKSGSITFYGGLVSHDGFTTLILLGLALTASIAALAAGREPLLWESSPGFYSLLPLALFGSFFIVGANDALVVLASWLLVSVISYVVVALPSDKESRAAAVRYILVGAVATFFIAIWAASNTVSAAESGQQGFTVAGLTLDTAGALAFAALLAGLGFKLGVVPFHWWLPSVYGKANGLVVSIVSGVVKLAFIGLFARLIYLNAGTNLAVSTTMAIVLAVLAVATMTYGNIAALTAPGFKRVLAYSSIAHVGYILAGAAALAYAAPVDPGVAKIALAGIAVQAIAYGISKSALFPIAEEAGDNPALAGQGRLPSSSTAVLLLSLLGMPPLLGFWGKLYLFIAAASYSIILVAVALINSAISSAYYVRLAREAVSSEGAHEIPDRTIIAVIIAAAATILLGIIAPLAISSITLP